MPKQKPTFTIERRNFGSQLWMPVLDRDPYPSNLAALQAVIPLMDKHPNDCFRIMKHTVVDDLTRIRL